MSGDSYQHHGNDDQQNQQNQHHLSFDNDATATPTAMSTMFDGIITTTKAQKLLEAWQQKQ
jgi:hypothetical protein